MAATPLPNDRPIKVLALASKPWGIAPGQRYRFEQWAPHLAKDHGIEIELAPFESDRLCDILYEPGHRIEKAGLALRDFARRFADIERAAKADAVLLFREAALLGPPIIERRIARGGTPLILDFDDAIWRPGEERSKLFDWLRGYSKFDELCAMSSAITAGNDFLAQRAANCGRNIHVLPTSIDTDEYVAMPEADSDEFVIAWTGSNSTLAHFETARPALEALAAKRPIAVRVICNRPPDRPINGARNIFIPWSSEGEAADVANCHVGIMPLPDNEFARGKCGLKALQFMATGRPVVVSPVGVNASIVVDGKNGFHAINDEDWISALDRLASDAPLRAQMGAAGRARVLADFSARHLADLFANVVRGIL